MIRLARNLLLFCCIGWINVSYAWNAVGHMVVANIAYQNLTPTAKAKVDKLINALGKEYPDIVTFQQAAPWPDTLRGQRIELFTHWHYIDIPFSGDGTPIKSNIDSDNGLWAMTEMEPVLKNAGGNVFEHARFLAFFEHIVADLHQPLHTVTRITAAHVNGDLGGNLFLVHYPRVGTAVTLHELWDDGCGLLVGSPTPENIDALTKTITSSYPKSYFGEQADDTNPNHWLQEGMNLATTAVYNTPEGQVPGEAYLEAGRVTVEQRIALAGYRLSHLLNTLLG